MAKASRHFFGTDTYGRHVEIAQRVDGVWFSRVYEFNGYAKAWTSWAVTDEPSFETHGTNQYSGEKFQFEEPVCMWGWNKLSEMSGPHRIRLPNQ